MSWNSDLNLTDPDGYDYPLLESVQREHDERAAAERLESLAQMQAEADAKKKRMRVLTFFVFIILIVTSYFLFYASRRSKQYVNIAAILSSFLLAASGVLLIIHFRFIENVNMLQSISNLVIIERQEPEPEQPSLPAAALADPSGELGRNTSRKLPNKGPAAFKPVISAAGQSSLPPIPRETRVQTTIAGLFKEPAKDFTPVQQMAAPPNFSNKKIRPAVPPKGFKLSPNMPPPSEEEVSPARGWGWPYSLLK